MMSTDRPRRAIGIVRVSRVNGREGESFASPTEQADRIVAACERDGLQLVDIVEELDVSGGKPLDERPGLGPAVRGVENGEYDVVVGAYFDRLFRSLRAQGDAVERVERAGGQVLAVDVGQVTNGSAGQWLSGTMLGAVAEYQRRTTAERSREAQQRALDRGVAPWPRIPPGYVRDDDGRLLPDDHAATVREAFERRATGASVKDVRAFLAEHGIKRSYHGVGALLKSRVYLGELHFGDYEPNLKAHPAIVERDLWQRVQDASAPRGRRAKSDRLLARLGILRCGTCNARMVVGTHTQNGRSYPFYRCPPTGDCPNRMAISAVMAETKVADATKAAHADLRARASAEASAREAVTGLEAAQAALDQAVRGFAAAGVGDEPSAVERLAELRAARDEAQKRADRLGGVRASVSVSVDDWDRLTADERRGLIRSALDSATVLAGRGPDRIVIKLLGE